MNDAGTVVITGVNRGLGEGLARVFLAQGWRVVGLGRQAPAWASGDVARFSFRSCDFADHQSVARACARIVGPVDVFIANAATFGGNAFHSHEFDPAVFTETMAVNVVAPVLIARLLRTQMAGGARRLLVFMSTGNASLEGNTSGTMLAYRASKAALNQSMRTLAADWSSGGTTAVALNPGWIRTEMGGPNAPLSVDEAAAAILDFVERLATPELNGRFVNVDGSPLPW
jgi:NAD(P)-dependent dehydrogenase (short-subunit alcohol dehydrogenase family)